MSVQVVCTGGDQVEFTEAAAKKSKIFENLMEDGDESLAMPSITKPVMEKVKEFCEYAQDKADLEIEKPLSSADLSTQIDDQWYITFIDSLDKDTLFEIVMAANFLDIKPLLDLAGAKVASNIYDKEIPAVRDFFGVENDFSQEEEAFII